MTNTHVIILSALFTLTAWTSYFFGVWKSGRVKDKNAMRLHGDIEDLLKKLAFAYELLEKEREKHEQV